jgi:hypothetical protein
LLRLTVLGLARDTLQLPLDGADPATQRIALRGQADVVGGVFGCQPLPIDLGEFLRLGRGDVEQLLKVFGVPALPSGSPTGRWRGGGRISWFRLKAISFNFRRLTTWASGGVARNPYQRSKLRGGDVLVGGSASSPSSGGWLLLVVAEGRVIRSSGQVVPVRAPRVRLSLVQLAARALVAIIGAEQALDALHDLGFG